MWEHIVSDEGFGGNEYIETTRPLVLVTAPGPGSGKMATCLSQLYQEHRRGINAGYAKFETFPIWNLPLTHPVNVAYEAATADLDDVNMIDPFHLEAYGVTTVNYNRDVEIFPVLNALFEYIYGLAGKDDISELVRLRIAYMIDDFGTISEYERQCMEEQLLGYFDRRLGKELIAFVARAEGRLVAAAYLLIIEKPANPFLPNGLDGEVLSVYTESEYRGKGICTQLMKNMIEFAKESKLCRIDLMATDEGYPVYKKVGFEDRVQKYIDMRLKL